MTTYLRPSPSIHASSIMESEGMKPRSLFDNPGRLGRLGVQAAAEAGLADRRAARLPKPSRLRKRSPSGTDALSSPGCGEAV
jgi:hypothetical protein